MKLITAVIKPFKIDEIRATAVQLGVTGMTVTEVKGYGRQKGHTEIYREAEYLIEFLPKIKLEVVVDDAIVDRLIEVIELNARTGKAGDGKIFVHEIVTAVRIRTGETGNAAL